MPPISRYVRAFFIALQLTLRGEGPPPHPRDAQYPLLLNWMKETLALVDAVTANASVSQTDLTQWTQPIEGRVMSADVILKAVRFHAVQEYPHLIRNEGAYGFLAIQSSNMNDVFYVSRLLTKEGLSEPLAQALTKLHAHLRELPPDERRHTAETPAS